LYKTSWVSGRGEGGATGENSLKRGGVSQSGKFNKRRNKLGAKDKRQQQQKRATNQKINKRLCPRVKRKGPKEENEGGSNPFAC